MEYHITRDGDKILLADLELSHLINIIKWIERKAVDGIAVLLAGGGADYDSIWYDERDIYGEKALKWLNYYDYVAELNRRKDETN